MRRWRLLLAACALLQTVTALHASNGFNLTKRNITESKGVALPYRDFPGYFMSKFAFGKEGILKAKIKMVGNGTDKSSCFHLAFCDVTRDVVRDSSYQMKRVSIFTPWRQNLANDVCKRSNSNSNWSRAFESSIDCEAVKLENGIEIVEYPSKGESRIYSIELIACKCAYEVPVRVDYSISMRNLNTSFEYFGWDEVAYPVAPTVIVAFAAVIFVTVMAAFALAAFHGKAVPFVAKVVLVTVALKILSSGLTATVYWRTAHTGKLMLWFFALRVPLIIVDEIMIGLLMLVMSTGVGLMPPSWMFDRRSSTFAIFLGMLLHARCHDSHSAR